MRHYHRQQPRSFFRGAEFMRLMTGIVMLAVLAMLVFRARDPNMWRWLADEEPVERAVAETPKTPQGDSPIFVERKSGQSPTTADQARRGRESVSMSAHRLDSSELPQSPTSETTPDPRGPTDEDPLEMDAAQEEFQAVTDGTLYMGREEMVPYDRVVQWVRNQPVERMQARAEKGQLYDHFNQTPDEHRGKLFVLDLHVRRVLKCEKKNNSPIQLYEILGWNDDSPGMVFEGIVLDLPEGMPIGPNVEEEVTLVGYFFKMQGYHPATFKPGDKPEKAPLLIGRLVWHPVQAPAAQSTDWYWGTVLVAGLLIVIIVRTLLSVLGVGRRRGQIVPLAGASTGDPGRAPIEDWLERAESGELPDDGPESEGNNWPADHRKNGWGGEDGDSHGVSRWRGDALDGGETGEDNQTA